MARGVLFHPSMKVALVHDYRLSPPTRHWQEFDLPPELSAIAAAVHTGGDELCLIPSKDSLSVQSGRLAYHKPDLLWIGTWTGQEESSPAVTAALSEELGIPHTGPPASLWPLFQHPRAVASMLRAEGVGVASEFGRAPTSGLIVQCLLVGHRLCVHCEEVPIEDLEYVQRVARRTIEVLSLHDFAQVDVRLNLGRAPEVLRVVPVPRLVWRGESGALLRGDSIGSATEAYSLLFESCLSRQVAERASA